MKKKKKHYTHTVSGPHPSMPIPEVKPGKPNLSAQTGKLHRFGTKTFSTEYLTDVCSKM